MNTPTNAVTTVVLTKNEAQQLPSLIENIKLFTNIILIVDSGSTDNTVEIARALGATVVYRAWTDSFAEQRNFALQHVNTPWIFYLDADERVTPELAVSIKQTVSQAPLTEAYTMERRSVIFNKELRKGAMKPDFVPRLFPTKDVTWVNKVHERPITNLPIKKLPSYLKHFTYSSWEQYWSKFNQYTTIWAENAYTNGKRTSFSSALSHSLLGFLKMGLLNGGFFEGKLGFTFTYYHAVYTFTKYIKLLELMREKGSTK
ncbi:glycosyltransferase family 2 protein [Veillonella sp. R32]|uniref:glycosyltransferase family 2 protein n=1 Tax=Veillonella sp. R32 TaxID=2021312 RepID=UPI00138A684B|nr:glycosyltransferase family 2 protein [Veillonella sp. R32]KAF1683450.1 benzoate transporter [Veillonella sp. R32]